MTRKKYLLPVRVGDRVELAIESLASGGDGICHHEGYTIFVPQSLAGDRVLCRIKKTTPRFGVASIIERVRSSKDRTDPPCPVFPQCGGCKIQDLQYEKQMEFKKQVVSDALQHIGKLKIPAEIKTIPADETFHYRNKGSFAIQKKAGKLRMGFFRQGTHDVVDSSVCDTLLPTINEVKEWIRGLLEKHDISIYDEKPHKGFLRGLIVRHSQSTGETLIGLITTKGKFPTAFLKDITNGKSIERFNVVGIAQNVNTQRTNVIMGDKNFILWGQDFLTERLNDIRFHLSLGSFFQVNPYQTIKLYDLIKQWATQSPGGAIDAYCGNGGISLWLGKDETSVLGIDEFPTAVEDAQISARLNEIHHCQFEKGKIEDHIPRFEEYRPVQTLILDPPRKGCSEKLIEALPLLDPQRIIYVSCNPATLARDLARLTDYQIEEIYVVDMFPQTQHIETAVLLKFRE